MTSAAHKYYSIHFRVCCWWIDFIGITFDFDTNFWVFVCHEESGAFNYQLHCRYFVIMTQIFAMLIMAKQLKVQNITPHSMIDSVLFYWWRVVYIRSKPCCGVVPFSEMSLYLRVHVFLYINTYLDYTSSLWSVFLDQLGAFCHPSFSIWQNYSKVG